MTIEHYELRGIAIGVFRAGRPGGGFRQLFRRRARGQDHSRSPIVGRFGADKPIGNVADGHPTRASNDQRVV